MVIVDISEKELEKRLEFAKNEIEKLSEKMTLDEEKQAIKSALEAFEIVAKGTFRSEYAYDFAKVIFNRLMSEKTLTPIENNKDDWKYIGKSEEYDISDEKDIYVSSRMDSLFKYVDSEGNESYCDFNRFSFYDSLGEAFYPDLQLIKAVEKILDIPPISFPYLPESPIAINVYSFLQEENDNLGYYDTIKIISAETTVTKPINRYFKVNFENLKLEEIDANEYVERLEN